MKRLTLIIATLFVLAGCGERSQSTADGRNAGDLPAYQGAKNSYVAKGWTAGDKTSWEKHIQTRNQAQNEYNRTN